VAPNKATRAFQDERQVYRREFIRAELQRVEVEVCTEEEGDRMRREERERERETI
jgi:hypothetical protein